MENIIIYILIACLIIYSIVNTVYIRSVQKLLAKHGESNFDTHTILSGDIDRNSQRIAALENEKLTVEQLAKEASDRYQAEVSSLLGYSGSKGREDN